MIKAQLQNLYQYVDVHFPPSCLRIGSYCSGNHHARDNGYVYHMNLDESNNYHDDHYLDESNSYHDGH